jgi:membrane-bound serine protease (ClpP class)
MTASRARALVFAAAVLALVVVPYLAGPARAQSPRVLVADIDGPIDRATLDYVIEAIDEATFGGYATLVFRFDTPGGGLDETLEIAARMNRASTLPILGFVGPVGAEAASAGTILLVSTDLAGMAPGTTIGSVQPVVIGPGGFEPVTDEKILSFVVNVTEEQLSLHGRNVSLASRFVRDNWNLNASEALAYGGTEVVAPTIADFLSQAHGRRVLVQSGGTVYKDLTLDVAGAEIVSYAPSVRVRFISILSDPLVSSLLLILGIYALIFGLSAPGHGGEIAGIILVLLALVGLGFSVDPIALFLIVLGIVLIIVELKTPGFGAFGVGGIVSITVAAVFLAPLRPPDFVVTPEYQAVFLAALLTPTIAFGAFLLFALYKVIEVRRRKPQIGAMVGDEAVAVDPIPAGGRGYVTYEGELWQAVAKEDLAPGAKAFIESTEGIILHVSTTPPPTPERRLWFARLVEIARPKAPKGPGNP